MKIDDVASGTTQQKSIILESITNIQFEQSTLKNSVECRGIERPVA